MDSLGLTTCLTGTDTVGTEYNGAAGAAVIANVDGTTASVNAALTAISSGTLPGLVPGVSLINALAVANADKVAYGVTAAASNSTFDANKDGVVTAEEAKDAFDTANTARFTGVSPKSTADLTADLNTKVTDLAAAKFAVTTVTGGSAAVAAYDTAVAAEKTLIGTVTAAAAKTAAEGVTAAVKASIDVAVPATGTGVSFETLSQAFAGNTTAITDSTSLITKLKVLGTDTASITAHTKLVAELGKVTTFGAQLIAAVDKELALDKAAADVLSTGNTLKAVDNSLTLGVVEGVDYINKATAQTSANDILVKAQAADAALNTAKVVVDKYTSLDTAILSSKTAINNFVAANADKVAISDISGGTSVQATAKSDVFYFVDKAAIATPDFSIGGTINFGAGDSIVLGSGYTFNTGALSTGNANTLEFFLVKGTTGTQVVIENDAFGNSNTVVGADGNITASPNATVINLVGVTADHLSVANGVVSYV